MDWNLLFLRCILFLASAKRVVLFLTMPEFFLIDLIQNTTIYYQTTHKNSQFLQYEITATKDDVRIE